MLAQTIKLTDLLLPKWGQRLKQIEALVLSGILPRGYADNLRSQVLFAVQYKLHKTNLENTLTIAKR